LARVVRTNAWPKSKPASTRREKKRGHCKNQNKANRGRELKDSDSVYAFRDGVETKKP